MLKELHSQDIELIEKWEILTDSGVAGLSSSSSESFAFLDGSSALKSSDLFLLSPGLFLLKLKLI